MSSVFLSITSGSVNVASIASRRGAPVELTTKFVTLIFTVANRFVKVFLGMTINKQIKHNKSSNTS